MVSGNHCLVYLGAFTVIGDEQLEEKTRNRWVEAQRYTCMNRARASVKSEKKIKDRQTGRRMDGRADGQTD